MGLVVQKYGGSSVADAESVKRVAARIVETKKAGHDVVVIVSAMGDTTDDLIDLAERVSPKPAARELAERSGRVVRLLAVEGPRTPVRAWSAVLADLREVITSGHFTRTRDEDDCRYCDFVAACGGRANAQADTKMADAKGDAFKRLSSHA